MSAEIAVVTATRGLMVSNGKPVSGWMPIKSSKAGKKTYDARAEIKSLGLLANTSTNVFATDYSHYAKIILKK